MKGTIKDKKKDKVSKGSKSKGKNSEHNLGFM